MEAANALKIAMTTLDPRRDVFRFRRSSKATPNNNSNSATSEAARQPQRYPQRTLPLPSKRSTPAVWIFFLKKKQQQEIAAPHH